jgi:hypothetical protein
MDAPSVPPLQIYPSLWAASRRQFPRDEQWEDQFRCLCALARRYRRKNRAEYCRLPEGERLFLQSLDQVDVEDFIATLRSKYPRDPNPMLRIDPSDPYVDKSQYRDLYPVQMNGKRYGHA